LRVGRAIESALNQTHNDIDVIVVDDGSNDATREEYKRFEGKIKLIQLEREDIHERNPSRPRNVGLKEAKGEYIAFLDSDNYYGSDFVENSLLDIKDVSFCDWRIFGKQNVDVKIDATWKMEDDVLKNYLQYTRLDHQCLLMRTWLVRSIGGYDERFARSQDCEFIVRLISNTTNWNYIPHTMFFFEKHEDDQMKAVASIYGKMLWFLKHNLNISIMFEGYTRQNYNHCLAMAKAMEDFRELDMWKEDFDKSEYKKQLSMFSDKLEQEWTE